MDVILLFQSSIVLVVVFLAVHVFRPVAHRCRLIDVPDHRKRHRYPTPLVGGYALLVGLILALAFSGLLADFAWQVFLGTVVALTVLGTVDDMLDVSARLRFFLQGMVVALALAVSHVAIQQLGTLLGSQTVEMDFLAGLAFTVLCALAAINAYNMIDGIDGLSGSVVLVTLLGIALLSAAGGASGMAVMVLLLAFAIVVFLAFNLELPFFRGHKIFLGDSGSTSLGFIVMWLLAMATQKDHSLRPITAVWLVGLPIVDMLAVFVRRLVTGQSPFSADRTHIHHLLMARGLSPRWTLGLLAGFQTLIVATGVTGELLQWSEQAMTAGAIVIGVAYLAVSWRLASGARERARVAARSNG